MEINPRLLPKLYLIGDSNVQKAFFQGGFASKLSNEYIRKVDLVNRGFSGYTSEYLRVMIPKLLLNDNMPRGSIHTATILLGSNDSVVQDLDDRHVPVHRYKENIEFIIQSLQDSGIHNIILISPPPVDDVAWSTHLKQTANKSGATSNSNLKAYVDICSQLVSKYQTHYVPLYEDMIKLKDWKTYLSDGLHFSPKGNQYVFYKLKELLDPILQDLPFVYPDWPLINTKCPEKYLA